MEGNVPYLDHLVDTLVQSLLKQRRVCINPEDQSTISEPFNVNDMAPEAI